MAENLDIQVPPPREVQATSNAVALFTTYSALRHRANRGSKVDQYLVR